MQALGIDSTVLDTGKKATGGRCSSRKLQVEGKTHINDHSCQFFTATSDRLIEELQPLKSDGTIHEWKGKMIQIQSPTVHVNVDSNPKKPWLVGKEGMGSFSKTFSDGLDIKRPVWVSTHI